MLRHPLKTDVLLYALLLVVAGVVFALIPRWTVDDAFISYRYGYNLRHFGELNWNIGVSPAVEGYTGIFLPLLAAFVLWIGLPLVGTIQVLGVLAFIGIFWMVDGLLRDGGTSRSVRFAILSMVVASPLLYVHGLSGLETIFFTFFLIGVFRYASQWWNSKAQATPFLAAFLVLAGITRPEGLLLGWLLILLVLIQIKHYKSFNNKLFHFLVIVLALFPPMVWWLWRSLYYQDLLPNTFYAKAYDRLLCMDSLKDFLRFAVYYCLLPLGTGLSMRLSMGRKIVPNGRSEMGLVLGVFFAAICFATYLHSHLYMNYASRFFVPFFPLALVIAGFWLDSAKGKWWTNASISHRRGIVLFLCLAVACQMLVLVQRWRDEHYFMHYYQAIVDEELIPTGEFLRDHLPLDATVISYMDAGAVGYYSGLKVVDFGRLNDRYLAKSKPNSQAVRDYFFAQNAAAIVITSESNDAYSYIPEAEEIVSDSRFSQYKLVKQLGNSAGFPYWQWIYFRKPSTFP